VTPLRASGRWNGRRYTHRASGKSFLAVPAAAIFIALAKLRPRWRSAARRRCSAGWFRLVDRQVSRCRDLGGAPRQRRTRRPAPARPDATGISGSALLELGSL